MKIAVNGAAGAMGRRIVAMALQTDDCDVVAGLEHSEHPELGRDLGELGGIGPIGVPLSAELTSGADVLVDFSAPRATVTRAREAAALGMAVLVGTTGLSQEHRDELTSLADRVPVLVAPNMAIGVNLLFDLAARVAGILGEGYDIEIIEAHHRRKVDAPSGTAAELARKVCEALGRDEGQTLIYGRQGAAGPRSRQEIAVHAVRGGDIVGDHTVLFAAEGERLELVHRASSRDVFVRGALRAAAFLAGRPPGSYTMQDVLAV